MNAQPTKRPEQISKSVIKIAHRAICINYFTIYMQLPTPSCQKLDKSI